MGDSAFLNCYSLFNLTVPQSVTKMGADCFGTDSDGNYERAIYGKKGSAAETYAKKNGIDFRTGKSIASCTISIPYYQYTYTGNPITPEVTIKNGSTKLVKGTDYTVSYSNNTKVGVATIKITGKGNYKGTITKTFVVKPAKNNIVLLTSTKVGAFTLKWTKGTAGTVGYEIAYSKDKNFKTGVNTWTTTNVSKTSENFSKVPKSGETWYVKVRSFYTKDGKSTSTRCGNYSSVQTIKVK
ncbi:MAG: hypothetical protein IJ746_00035 [Ruminococcus sp.]|nr:hypothetical protein [Ruminococcus sp.]